MSDLVLSIRLTADGKGLVGEVRGSAEELKKLGQAARQSNDQGKGAAEQFTASLKRQADTLGMTRGQTLAYEAAQHNLTGAQRQGVLESIRAIDAYDRKQQVLQRVRFAAVSAGTAIATVLVAGLRASVTEAAAAEQAHLKLEAVLRGTGFAAGLTKAQLDAEAESLKGRTGIDDDKIRDSMAVMLTFRQVQGDTFRQAMTMAADLSKLLGQDLQSSVLQLGKALEDPESGLLALRRAGVSFNDAAKETIKQMVAVGREGEALELILKTMRQQGIDRVAEAMNTGYVGSMNRAGNAYNDLLKAIGNTALVREPTLAFLDALATRLDRIKSAIESGNWVMALARINPLTAPLANLMPLPAKGAPGAAPGTPLTAPPEESRASIELGRQEDMRDRAIAAASGVSKREGAGWEALEKFWKEFVKALQQQAATLGMTTEQAKLYEAAQLGISGAQLEAAKAAVATIEQYRTEQEALQSLEAQASAERAAQERAEAALKTRAEREIVEMEERLARLATENMTEIELIQTQLDAKSALLNAAYAKKLIDEEMFESQSLLILAKYAKAKTTVEKSEQQQRFSGAAQALGNMSSLMQSHNRATFEAGKVFAIGQALVRGYLAVQEAYEDGMRTGGFWWAAAYAAAATVFTGMQITGIRNSSFGGGAAPVYSAVPGTSVPSGPSGAGVDAPPPSLPQAAAPRTEVNITIVGENHSAAKIRELIEEINEQIGFGATLNVTLA